MHHSFLLKNCNLFGYPEPSSEPKIIMYHLRLQMPSFKAVPEPAMAEMQATSLAHESGPWHLFAVGCQTLVFNTHFASNSSVIW